jgi:hypothetical protein
LGGTAVPFLLAAAASSHRSGATPPSSVDIARELQRQLGDGVAVPGERVIRDWIRRKIIQRREDVWTVFDRDTAPEDLPLVLEALAAWIEDRRGTQFYTDHAEWVVRLRRAFPALSALDAADMASTFAAVESGRSEGGMDAAGLTRYLAFKDDDTR